MELVYDWQGLDHTFFKQLAKKEDSSLYVVTKGTRVLAAYAGGRSCSRFIGKEIDEVKREANGPVFAFTESKVQRRISEAIEAEHLLGQIESIQGSLEPSVSTEKWHGFPLMSRGHFLLAALQKGMRRLLPSTFALYVRLEDEKNKITDQLLVKFRRGKIESFQRLDQPKDKETLNEGVKRLGERYFINVLGIRMTASDWRDLSKSERPFKDLRTMLQEKRTEIFPLRFMMRVLFFFKSLFSRA